MEDQTSTNIGFNLKNIAIIVLFIIVVSALLVLILVSQKGVEEEVTTSQVTSNQVNMQEDLKKITSEDLKEGTGSLAENGKKVTVNYVGTLESGKKFDSSYDRGDPFQFNLGGGEVIRGWDLGVVGMKVGGKRRLTIPGELAYGKVGAAPDIPPDATLIFEVELLAVE